MSRVNHGTITDKLSLFKILPLNGFSILSVQTKTSQETEKSWRKFLEPSHKPKVIYADNSSECGKSCEDLSWNHRTSIPHRSEKNGIAARAVRRVKEGTSAVLQQSGVDVGLTVRNAIAICDMSKTSWQKGKLRTKDDLENHSKDQ